MPNLLREDLYALVWTDPMRTVAERFGMSDVGLKKHCTAANIPVPERGYWAKLAAGRKLPRPALPPREPGASDRVHFRQDPPVWNSDPVARLAEPVPEPPHFPEPLDTVRARAARRVGKLRHHRDLASPHTSLRKLFAADARRAEKARQYGWSWEKPLFDSGFEKRRMRFLNSLAMGLSKAGVRLEVRGQTGRELNVLVGVANLEIAVDHPKAKPNRHGEWQTIEGPADTLQLIIGKGGAALYRALWIDDEEGTLESKLTAIAVEIVTAGEAEYRARREESYAWALQERVRLEAEVTRRREEAERLARERQLADEQARRDHLFGQAQAWRTARDIRGFVAEVLHSALGTASPAATRGWADWALSEADALDPAIGGKLSLPVSGAVASES